MVVARELIIMNDCPWILTVWKSRITGTLGYIYIPFEMARQPRIVVGVIRVAF